MSPVARRVRLLVLAALLVGTAGIGAWWWLRPRRWDDSVHPPPPLARAMERFASGKPEEAEELARRCLTEYEAPAWESRIRILVASRLASAGHDERILSILQAPFATADPLSSHADLLRARGFAAARRWAEAAASAKRAADAAGFPGHEEAVREQAEAIEKTGRIGEAIALLDRGSSPSLRLEAAHVALRNGDRRGARRRLAAILLEAPAGDDAERALDLLESTFADPSDRFSSSERAQILQAVRRWKNAGRLQPALDLLRAPRRAGAAPSALGAEEAVLEADILIRQGRPAAADPLLARAMRSGGAVAEEALYLSAKTAFARGDAARYRRILLALGAKPGHSRWKLAALSDLARLEEGKPTATALAAYLRYRLAAADDAETGALWREAWAAYDLGRYREADEGIARVLRRTDAPAGVRAAALYWAGRRLEATGRTEAARARYREIVARSPSHYYGVLAARRLGLADPRVLDRAQPAAPDPSSPSARRWVGAARALRSVGLWDLAASAYRAAAALSSERAAPIELEAADGALEAESSADAVEFVQRAIRDRDLLDPSFLTLRHLRLLVPAPRADQLEAAARSAGLDPDLIAAVVLQESAFNPLAVSSAGARGLLQLLPSTGAELAARLGLRDFRPDSLFDPATNLRLGCVFFKDILTKAGSVPVALAAYNAGPARAARWVTPGDDPDGERYVERIPILETRGYVKRILASERLYALAYPDGIPGEGS